MPQVDNERLNINDSHPTTDGGPPGWVALATVGGIFLLVVAVIVGAVMIWSSFPTD